MLPLDQPSFNVRLGVVPWSLMTLGVPWDINHKIYAQSGRRHGQRLLFAERLMRAGVRKGSGVFM